MAAAAAMLRSTAGCSAACASTRRPALGGARPLLALPRRGGSAVTLPAATKQDSQPAAQQDVDAAAFEVRRDGGWGTQA